MGRNETVAKQVVNFLLSRDAVIAAPGPVESQFVVVAGVCGPDVVLSATRNWFCTTLQFGHQCRGVVDIHAEMSDGRGLAMLWEQRR